MDEMADAGANQYTFHIEATGEWRRGGEGEREGGRGGEGRRGGWRRKSVTSFPLLPFPDNPTALIQKIKARGMKVRPSLGHTMSHQVTPFSLSLLGGDWAETRHPSRPCSPVCQPSGHGAGHDRRARVRRSEVHGGHDA